MACGVCRATLRYIFGQCKHRANLETSLRFIYCSPNPNTSPLKYYFWYPFPSLTSKCSCLSSLIHTFLLFFHFRILIFLYRFANSPFPVIPPYFIWTFFHFIFLIASYNSLLLHCLPFRAPLLPFRAPLLLLPIHTFNPYNFLSPIPFYCIAITT